MDSSTFIRSSFKGSSAGALKQLQLSKNTEARRKGNTKARLEVGLRKNRLKQILQTETTRKRL